MHEYRIAVLLGGGGKYSWVKQYYFSQFVDIFTRGAGIVVVWFVCLFVMCESAYLDSITLRL